MKLVTTGKPAQKPAPVGEMTEAQARAEAARIRRLLPNWKPGRWTVERQGNGFRVRRFGWPATDDAKKAQYYFLLSRDLWASLRGMNDELISRTLTGRANRKRADDANERTGTDG